MHYRPDTWIDKEVEKHKHEYIINCILEEKELGKNMQGPLYFTHYDNVLMCNKCHSFIRDSFIGFKLNKDTSGNIELTEEQKKLPRIIATNNTNITRYKYIDELIFPDNYKWIKHKK